MKFDLKAPCPKCPFRTDVVPFLSAARAREIVAGITDGDATFSCHAHNEFDEDEQGECVVIEGDRAQHCAGALIMLERMEQPNQMMRIAERIRLYDRTRLKMDSPVYADGAAMIAAYRKGAR